MTLSPTLLIALGACIVLAFVFLLVLLVRKPKPDTRTAELLSELKGVLETTRTELAQSRSGLRTDITQRLDGMGDRTQTAMTFVSDKTHNALSVVQERLASIDRAHQTMETLSQSVTGLTATLANKQARGVLGEVQLHAILSDVLPGDLFSEQQTLSNGKRVDALVQTGGLPIGVDAKFPLSAYQTMLEAKNEAERTRARTQLGNDMLVHVKAVAEKYILPGETADSALLFVPAESVYAELHASHPDLVRKAGALRVWIVSPSTLMAVLTTLRALHADTRIIAQADKIRKELSLLVKDVERLVDRSSTLHKHLDQAAQLSDAMALSAEKAGRRATRLSTLEFEE